MADIKTGEFSVVDTLKTSQQIKDRTNKGHFIAVQYKKMVEKNQIRALLNTIFYKNLTQRTQRRRKVRREY